MQKETIHRHRHLRDTFLSIRSLHQLCQLLRTDTRRLEIFLQQPLYRTFSVPKKSGGHRQIEDPKTELKRVLSNLNRYLQSVYLFEKSSAAYGFIVGVNNDNDRRNVLTNARKHVNRPYLLNIDLKDFFHHVTFTKVQEIFQNKPFRFKSNLADVLAGLTTYQGRLPMGAPTSPVLSNFACRGLDEQLITYCSDMLWVYTRYADDMSFSAKVPFEKEKVRYLRKIIEAESFVINENKVQYFKKNDLKIVTGLLVSDKVSLTTNYLPDLHREIARLADIMRAQNEQGQLSTKWVREFKQQIQGRMNFAGFVIGRKHSDYQALKESFYQATRPPEEEFGIVNWRGFPYNF